MSLDYMNNKDSKFKAFGGFIFGGSSSIGVMRAGYNVDRILEMTDNMATELNAYHFSKNFKEVPIITPSEWENEEYLGKMRLENYDLGFFNCPCSSLSQINRNASVGGKNNEHFYRVFNAINLVKPKVFLIENAPTLIKLGYSIIKDMINKLGDDYRFTIIRDYAGNHNVAMKRMRTLVIGWNKNEFDKIPLVHMDKQDKTTTKDVIGDLYDVDINNADIYNFTTLPEEWDEISGIYNMVDENSSVILDLIKNWDNMRDKINNKSIINQINTAKDKLDNGKRIWDKSPWKPKENDTCPSMTSVTKIIHPKKDRTFTIREYARLMNYPDDFKFFDECKVDIIQCISQGVPSNFITYITKEIREVLDNNRDYIEDTESSQLSFQYHTQSLYKTYTKEECLGLKYLDSDKSFKKLHK